MTEQEIEKEIQARVEFKMNEFMTGIKNMIKYEEQKYHHSTAHPKYAYRAEAMTEVNEMLSKEISMSVPYDDMNERRKRWAKDNAVEAIERLVDLRGRPGRDYKIRMIASAIEKAQNY